jgi:hypothetical protein
VQFKDSARRLCKGEWCILLDCDEFIPEWEFPRLREYLERTQDLMVPAQLINFYGNYKVYNCRPEKVNWPARKMIIHRNLPQMEVWGDGSNVRLKGQKLSWDVSAEQFLCHHFGFVRNPARLRQKWRNVFGGMYAERKPWFKLPTFLFKWRPHNWKDPQFLDDLALYDGPFIKAVRDNPAEFVRDNSVLYHYLSEKASVGRTDLPCQNQCHLSSISNRDQRDDGDQIEAQKK